MDLRWQLIASLLRGGSQSINLGQCVRLGFLSDQALIAAQAHTRGLYLVQRGNREQRYSRALITNLPKKIHRV